MEFGWALRRPMRLPDSPRHERRLPAALRGVGVKPECFLAEDGVRGPRLRPQLSFACGVELKPR
uniref:Uncharacterized protein n=1 Tax=Oryza sativa subsp. japonica TaxID=39947 RepID=Q6YW17_ORYSJ|nr:hypothetical protein [Oryza sativa Japonica Group]